jgi:hypothetical protein
MRSIIAGILAAVGLGNTKWNRLLGAPSGGPGYDPNKKKGKNSRGKVKRWSHRFKQLNRIHRSLYINGRRIHRRNVQKIGGKFHRTFEV